MVGADLSVREGADPRSKSCLLSDDVLSVLEAKQRSNLTDTTRENADERYA